MRTLKRSVILMAICAGISLCGFSQMIEDAEIDAIVSKGIRTAQGQRNTDGSVTLPIDPSQSFDTPQRKEAAGKLKSMVLESKDSKKKLAAMRGLMKMSLYPLSKERAADLFSEVSREDLETLRDYYASNKEYLALRMNLEILRDRSEDSEEKCGYEWDLCWVQILDGSIEELQKMPQELDRMSKSVKSESMIGKKVSLLREAVTGPKTLPAFYLAADIYNERRLKMEGNNGDLYWGTIIEQGIGKMEL